MQRRSFKDAPTVPAAGGRRALPRVAALLALGLLVPLEAGCTEWKPASESFPLPLASPAAVKDPPLAVPEDVQLLEVRVVDGQFQSDRYAVQSRPVTLQVTTRGGPYTLQIAPLLQPQTLPPNNTTTVSFTAPNPGDYTMQLTGPSGEATAVLDVRPPGTR